MKLSDLADLALVIGHAKNVLNTSSLTRFPKEDILALKKKIPGMEDAFVKGVLSLDKYTSETVTRTVSIPSFSVPTQEAVRLDGGGFGIKAPDDEPILATTASTATVSVVDGNTWVVTGDAPVETAVVTVAAETVVEAPKVDDSELRARLAEEKKKLSAKPKKAEKVSKVK